MTIPDTRPDGSEIKQLPRPTPRPELPKKPYADFPLFPERNGQWAKKVRQHKYYFGSWRSDRKGEAAVKDWLERKDGILAGLDNLRVSRDPASGLTVGELMGKYLVDRRADMLKGELSPQTYGDYVRELSYFTSTVGVTGIVAALSPAHFSEYGKHLAEQRKLGRHARKRVVAYIKAMFHWGSEMGYPSPAFGAGFKSPDTSPSAMRKAKARAGEKDHSTRIVTGEEVDKLLDVSQPQFKAMILMGVNTGLGPADIGRLRWRDIDMETGELNAPRGKTGAARRVYLWKRTRRALDRVRTLKRNKRLIESDGSDALVFVSRKGHPMYRESETVKDGASTGVKVNQAISITFGRLAKRAGLADGVTFYRLRHTFKTLGKKANDRDALDLAMGHVQPGQGKVYDHEDIGLDRLKRVAIAVKRGLWIKRQSSAGMTRRKMGAAVVGAGAVV